MMTQRFVWAFAVLGGVGLGAASTAQAVVLSNQDFEAATPGAGSGPLFTFAGDGGFAITSTITDTGGVGGSNGYTASWDGTANAGSYYYFGFGEGGPVPAPVGYAASEVTFSIDLMISGAILPAPFTIEVNQANPGGGNAYTSTFDPVLVNDAGYVTASFVLSTGNQTGAYDPNKELSWVIYGNNGGFGFDAGNAISLDNVTFSAVPEPASLALLGLGGLALVGRRRA